MKFHSSRKKHFFFVIVCFRRISFSVVFRYESIVEIDEKFFVWTPDWHDKFQCSTFSIYNNFLNDMRSFFVKHHNYTTTTIFPEENGAGGGDEDEKKTKKK